MTQSGFEPQTSSTLITGHNNIIQYGTNQVISILG